MSNLKHYNRNNQVQNNNYGVTPTHKNDLAKPTTSVNDAINNALIGQLVQWIYHGKRYAGTILQVHGGEVTVDINGCAKFIPNFKTVKSKNIHVLPLTRVAFCTTTPVDVNNNTNQLTNGK